MKRSIIALFALFALTGATAPAQAQYGLNSKAYSDTILGNPEVRDRVQNVADNSTWTQDQRAKYLANGLPDCGAAEMSGGTGIGWIETLRIPGRYPAFVAYSGQVDRRAYAILGQGGLRGELIALSETARDRVRTQYAGLIASLVNDFTNESVQKARLMTQIRSCFLTGELPAGHQVQ
jgi:hypothetical protein